MLAAFEPETSGADISRVLVTTDAGLEIHEISGDGSAVPGWAEAQGYAPEQVHLLGFYPEAVQLKA